MSSETETQGSSRLATPATTANSAETPDSFDTGETFDLDAVDAVVKPSRTSALRQYCRTAPSEELRDNRGRLLFLCENCPFKTSVSTNFQKHLATKHNIEIEIGGKIVRTKNAQQAIEDITKRLQSTEVRDQILQEMVDKKVLESTLLELIFVRNLPFRIVESAEFQAFCFALNPQALKILPASHSTITKKVASPIYYDRTISANNPRQRRSF